MEQVAVRDDPVGNPFHPSTDASGRKSERSHFLCIHRPEPSRFTTTHRTMSSSLPLRLSHTRAKAQDCLRPTGLLGPAFARTLPSNSQSEAEGQTSLRAAVAASLGGPWRMRDGTRALLQVLQVLCSHSPYSHLPLPPNFQAALGKLACIVDALHSLLYPAFSV